MLREIFRQYLEDMTSPERRASLVGALRAGGLEAEASLLAAYAAHGPGRHRIEGGRFSGREAHVGPRLPTAEAHALWLDTCELSLSILLGRDERDLAPLSADARRRLGETLGWMSLRPVERWQFGAFLDLAPREPVEQPYDPPFQFLDPRRLLEGHERGAVTRVTCDEAGSYAYWFGVSLAGEEEWAAATRILSPPPWGQPAREWAGVSYFDESLMIAVSPATVGVDPRNLVDEDDHSDRRMLYGEWAIPETVTFRTAVLTQHGLVSDDVPMNVVLQPVRILGRLARPAI